MRTKVSVSYAGGGRWSQHFNGASDGSGTFGQRTFLGFRESVPLAIGQHYGLRQSNTFYRGDLAEVLLFNRVLDAADSIASVGIFIEVPLWQTLPAALTVGITWLLEPRRADDGHGPEGLGDGHGR